jgi:hypothetical protein
MLYGKKIVDKNPPEYRNNLYIFQNKNKKIMNLIF